MVDARFKSVSDNEHDGQTTVIITAHNYGRYLAQCIDSVLGQSKPPFRVILVDDASLDNTLQVVEEYGRQVEYYRVDFHHPQKSRNFGLAKAYTEFVLFLDADNFLAEDMLEKLQRTARRDPNLRVVYCDRIVFGDAAAMGQMNLARAWKAEDFSIERLRFKNYIDFNSLVRRKFLIGFDDRIRRLQDWDTWLTILTADVHAARVPEFLLHYRAHGENLSIRQRELIERLKILVKHRLIASASETCGDSKGRSVAILTCATDAANPARWRDLAVRRGWHIRVIAGHAAAKTSESASRNSIAREGPVVIQTTRCTDLEDLLWRFAGTVTDDRIDAVIIMSDFRSNFDAMAALPPDGIFMRSDMTVDQIMEATSLAELGTISLTPSAARLLVYLPPPSRPTLAARLRRAARELAEQHVAWRFRRNTSALRRRDS